MRGRILITSYLQGTNETHSRMEKRSKYSTQ